MSRPLVLFFVLFTLPVLLLLPLGAKAQMTVAGPPSPAGRALTIWFAQHIPAKFQAHGTFEVQPLSDFDMDEYLHGGDSDDNSHSNSQSNSQDDDDEIDGVFVNHPPRILLRVPESGKLDFTTFAHEYGHYVWFDLLTGSDRKRYAALYAKQKSAHKLITDYAAEGVEEGFAEAFAAETMTPATLLHQDPLSARFLSEWPAKK